MKTKKESKLTRKSSLKKQKIFSQETDCRIHAHFVWPARKILWSLVWKKTFKFHPNKWIQNEKFNEIVRKTRLLLNFHSAIKNRFFSKIYNLVHPCSRSAWLGLTRAVIAQEPVKSDGKRPSHPPPTCQGGKLRRPSQHPTPPTHQYSWIFLNPSHPFPLHFC